jgi:membrane-associated phospholipid phosphatase
MRSIASKVGVVACIVAMLAIGKFHVSARMQGADDQIEPKAGSWKTWVLSSGSQFRLPAPPDKAATEAEIQQLKELAAKRDAASLDQIAYWDTGSPSYRWNEITVAECLKVPMGSPGAARNVALVNIAMYDAIVAAWDSKYAHNRPRPSTVDPTLSTVLPDPRSPAYPSEHAAAAGAASTVLAYLFPDNAKFFADEAEEAGQSRLLAGIDYPSDVKAGLELGRKIGALVVERGKADGSDVKWTGTVPTEKGKWTGTNPAFPMLGTWKPWILKSGDEFRPGPPPAFDSEQEKTELAEVVNFKRTPKTNADAFFWEYAVGGTRNYWFFNELTTRKIWEYRLDSNPPRAARVYALSSIANYESGLACFDAKYAYWAIRPFQLDPNFKPLFTTPNHPSYPSAHSCLSGGTTTVLAYLFPRDAGTLNSLAEQAGEARIWAGIHFRVDVVDGLALGHKVGEKIIEYAKNDGAGATRK